MSDVEIDAQRGRRLRRQAVLQNAKAAGLNPGTVIDVGFAIGTEGLFGVFEDAENFLIEPIAEMEPAMQAFCAQNPRSRYLLAAASDENGVKSMVARRAVGASGFHSNPKVGDAEHREIPTVTLDSVVRDYALPGPFVIKMDVEGHELHVLRGAGETLRQTELVMLEISVWNDGRKRGSASLMDLFRFMDEAGFGFYDIVEPHYRPLDGALAVFDGVWARNDGALRTSFSFRSPEQAAQARESQARRSRAFFGEA
jgi:FkbM family methyltransferase